MNTKQIKAIREKVAATQEKVYNTKVYQYWLNGNGELCRARRAELDTPDCKVEIIAAAPGALVKLYHVRPEYLHLWGSECTEETVIDERELRRLSGEWGISVDELAEQLVEIQ